MWQWNAHLEEEQEDDADWTKTEIPDSVERTYKHFVISSGYQSTDKYTTVSLPTSRRHIQTLRHQFWLSVHRQVHNSQSTNVMSTTLNSDFNFNHPTACQSCSARQVYDTCYMMWTNCVPCPRRYLAYKCHVNLTVLITIIIILITCLKEKHRRTQQITSATQFHQTQAMNNFTTNLVSGSFRRIVEMEGMKPRGMPSSPSHFYTTSNMLTFYLFTFSLGVDYVQRWGHPSIAAQCATPT